MGPYPLSDSTNLLGPGSSNYGPGGVLGSGSGSGQCYTNYGTNLQTPQAPRKCHYDEIDDYNFRRHSAHGRMSCRLTQHRLNNKPPQPS
ncbi:glucose transporter type 1-like [Drosophila rhopaloa]|uniref:Glucose transporter type 1-like n=1 Tax=Drosophila rhopaloa TaxID=1041015 RepID=A0A6P4FTK5_DRORH|nr:glucose transporter type 1-like [Drosophila rhopaloa]